MTSYGAILLLLQLVFTTTFHSVDPFRRPVSPTTLFSEHPSFKWPTFHFNIPFDEHLLNALTIQGWRDPDSNPIPIGYEATPWHSEGSRHFWSFQILQNYLSRIPKVRLFGSPIIVLHRRFDDQVLRKPPYGMSDRLKIYNIIKKKMHWAFGKLGGHMGRSQFLINSTLAYSIMYIVDPSVNVERKV